MLGVASFKKTMSCMKKRLNLFCLCFSIMVLMVMPVVRMITTMVRLLMTMLWWRE